MTGGYRDEYAFKRYTETPHGDLQLPGLSFRESDNRAAIYPGEIHCRAPHCSKTYKTTNALRKHYAATHDDIMLVSMAKGGRPSGKEEAAAIIWYHQIIAKLDSDQAAKAIIDPQLPALPLQKKGDAVSVSIMIGRVRGMGFSIPCEACRVTGKKNACCRDEHLEICEYFALFNDPRNHDGLLQASGSSAHVHVKTEK